MNFQEWWAKHGQKFWGQPVEASRESWNAAIEAVVAELDRRGIVSIFHDHLTIRQIIQTLRTEK